MTELLSPVSVPVRQWMLGTVLMEKHRWKRSAPPQLVLSQWLEPIRAGGFNALELWEFHYLSASEEERRKLIECDIEIPVFNTYAEFLDAPEQLSLLDRVGEAVAALGCKAVKFNVPHSPDKLEEALDVARSWAETLPQGVQLWCECHGGTPLETPEAAAKAFATLSRERFAAIVHPLSPSVETLNQWMQAIGDRVVHLHIQVRNEQNRFCPVSEKSELVRAAGLCLARHGFSGSAAMEFTTGCATPDETPGGLLQSAIQDWKFLQEAWS